MANDLTGPFDMVAEFSVGAINRVLAAMHGNERLPHSISVRVDPKFKFPIPVVDYSGLALANPTAVARVDGSAPLGGGPSTALSRLLTEFLDPVVNTVGTVPPPPPPPNPLHGVAQLQLGAPTVSFPLNAPSEATVHMPMIAQFVPDPNTYAVPRFLWGEIQVTVAATQQKSNAGTVIHVDFPRQGGNIQFVPAQPLDPAAAVSINAALESSLQGTFQPSNTPLPAQLSGLQISTMPQAGAAAVLMNLADGQPPAASVSGWTSFFLGTQDQFAVAVSADYLTHVLEAEFKADLAGNQNFTFDNHNSWPTHANGNATLGQVSIIFGDGYIQLTLQGHVWVYTSIGDFDSDITLSQKFTLNVVNGVVQLQLSGDLVLDTSSWIFNTVDFFSGALSDNARSAFLSAWLSNQARIQSEVASKLNASILQGFLAQLMTPVTQGVARARTMSRVSGLGGVVGTVGGIFVPPPPVVLGMTSVEIRRGGVVLHGSLTVESFPAAHAEFELVPNTAALQHPEYNALNSWIPGGTVQSYVWSYGGQSRPPDNTKFLSTNAPSLGRYGGIEAPSGTCVTLQGSRISAAGAVVSQAVAAGVCNGVTSALMSNNSSSTGRTLPDVGIVHVNAEGKLEIVGHLSPWATPSAPESASANVLAHFPDAKSIAQLDMLAAGLEESGRTDAHMSILCVLAPGQLQQLKNPAGMLFADDSRGWEQLFGVMSRPATALLAPWGKLLWRREGALYPHELAQLLNRNLSAQSSFNPQVIQMDLRTGDRAPNFAFEYSPGRQLTLRKLSGSQVVLVFWKGTSRPSEDALATVQKLFSSPGLKAPVLLAIDNSDSQVSKNAAAALDSFHGIMVPDSRSEISNAYGVRVWPTVVFLNEQGFIQEVRHGILNVKDSAPTFAAPSGTKP